MTLFEGVVEKKFRPYQRITLKSLSLLLTSTLMLKLHMGSPDPMHICCGGNKGEELGFLGGQVGYDGGICGQKEDHICIRYYKPNVEIAEMN